MKLSILMPSFNRTSQLPGALAALCLQKVGFEFETFVLNDAHEDGTREICQASRLPNLRYVFTGGRNYARLIRRNPGFPLNYAARRLATGEYLLLSCAEMLPVDPTLLADMVETAEALPGRLVIPDGRDDLAFRLRPPVSVEVAAAAYYSLAPLNTQYPFFMLLSRDVYVGIGGYDEDFLTPGYDDTDFVQRLQDAGHGYVRVRGRVLHQYHSQHHDNTGDIWAPNRKLFAARRGTVVRNQNRDWGTNL